jgi:hypothetical protein
LRTRVKGLFSRKKKKTETPAEPTKTEEPAAKPTESAITTEATASEAVTDPEVTADPAGQFNGFIPASQLILAAIFAKDNLRAI